MDYIKEHGKSNTCKHMGHEVNFSNTWWCNKQFDEPTEIHKNCDCKNCPDFEALEWDTYYTIAPTGNTVYTNVRICSLCRKEIKGTDYVPFGAHNFCKDCMKKMVEDIKEVNWSEYPYLRGGNNLEDLRKEQEFEEKYGRPIEDYMRDGKFKWEKENEN